VAISKGHLSKEAAEAGGGNLSKETTEAGGGNLSLSEQRRS
jgi:hypothetical protein